MHANPLPRSSVAAALLTAVVAIAATACTGDDPVDVRAQGTEADGGDGKPDVSRFLGTWTTTTAEQVIANCPFAQMFEAVPITLTVKKGTASDIVATNTLAPGCELPFNVDGDSATLVAGTKCSASIPPETQEYRYAQTSSFDLEAGNPAAATMVLTATITFSASGTVCGFTETSPFNKE